MSTLKDIANQTNLAVGTVSRILRGKERVSQATRKRVFEAAEDLKYRPNLLVRGIQTGSTNTIGVMMRMADEFRSGLMRGINHELVIAGYVPIVLSPPAPVQPPFELALLHELIDRRVDGLILYPTKDSAPDDYLREVWDRGLPLVTVDREMEHTHADFVGTDDTEGAKLGMRHLLDLGHRRILHLAGPDYASTAHARRIGAQEAAREIRDADLIIAGDSFRDVRDDVTAVFSKDPKPTAINCACDLQLPDVFKALGEMGLRVPQDVSVVGFADIEVARIWGVTTLRQDPESIGRTAARLLLDRLTGRVTGKAARKIRLMPELIVRQSTAQAPRQ